MWRPTQKLIAKINGIMFPPRDFEADLSGRLHGARTVVAQGVLDDAAAARVTQALLLLASASEDDVRVLFALHGKHLGPALAVHDVVSTMTPRVQMIATGRVAGAGVVAFCAAPIEDRTCLPMARFHLHALQASGPNTAHSFSHSAAADADRQLARAYDIIASATEAPRARVEEDVQRGLVLDAREAETYGLVARLTMRGEL